MRIEACDTVFVRARRRDVHPLLVTPSSYGDWWPGVTARSISDACALELRPPGRPRRRQRLVIQVRRVRADRGVHLLLYGDAAGDAEWYYLDDRAGTLVHYLLHADTRADGARRWLSAHRAVVRAGLHALKDLLEAGRAPGTEPDPRLLADQAETIRRMAGSGPKKAVP